MVKFIGIFAIVFVYYCEINAEVDNLQFRNRTTADARKILSTKKKLAASGGIRLRSNTAQRHAKFTTGFREDIKDPHKEYALRIGEARNNEHHVVKKRRFKINDRDEENKKIDEHDNERKTPKNKKRHNHQSISKKNKNNNSTRNTKTKRYKNYTKRNDVEEKYNKDRYKKHQYHLAREINRKNISTRKKKTKRNKNVDRNLHKDIKKIKLSKEKKNRSGKRNRDKNRSKNFEHPKSRNMMNKKEKDHINKKKQAKDKRKEKHREKSMDRNKYATKIRFANENDHQYHKKQKLNKSKDKHREKSKHTKDTSKTAIGIAGLGAAGAGALLGKFLASIKDSKLKSEQHLTSTTSPNSPPEPVQEREVVREKKLIKREGSVLRTEEKIRVTRIVPYSLQKQEDEKIPKLREKSEDRGDKESGSPPSHLSPYAIAAQMELLMKEFPNVNATVSKSGRTVEYNDLVVVSITAKKEEETYFRAKESKYIDEVPEKKIIFIVHGLTVMGLKDMTSLVKNSELKLLLSYYLNHLDKFDFFLMPLANPDGYSASLSSDRTIWNKNVSPQSVCPGVFVDRNFDVAWNHTKQLSSCSQLYPGATPFSEEESKAVREVFHRFSHKILAYIHVHAGTFDDKVFKGDAILYPRGYTESQSDDDKYIDIKGEVDDAMKNASFRVMSATVDTLFNWYGVVSGTSVDYAATVYGIPYAMEFVMQLYDSESLNNNALTEIWSRLIDATFNNMWKSLQGSSDTRRFSYLTH